MRTYLLILLALWSSVSWAAKGDYPLTRCVDRPYEVTQGLEGRHIALWGSHGLYYNSDQDRWTWQRARLWTTVEDLFTSSFTAPYLAPMLENAGAVVLQPRAYVRPGYQTVYVRWNKPSKKKQPIVVHRGNQTTSYTVNTSIGKGIWHYLCTVEKDSCYVEGTEYMLVDEHTTGPSGSPRFMEAARYWLPYIGVPDAAWVRDTTYSDYLNDIVCRGGWVNYMKSLDIPLDMSLAFHTDAGTTMNDSLIGTLLIYTNKDRSGKRRLPSGEPRRVSGILGDSIMAQVVKDIRHAYRPDWPKRDLRDANYGETRDPSVPAVLLELLSHQNYADMRYALDPAFRRMVARAVYKGIGRFMASRHNTSFIPQPLSPTALHSHLTSDSLIVTWQAQRDSLEPQADASYFVVFKREDGGAWDNGTCVSDCRIAWPLQAGVRYDICVAGGNAGGVSLRSDIVSSYRSTNNDIPILVVDAFDEVRGPKMMAFDSLTGGIVPGSRPIPDGYEMAYIGEQINYNRRDPWHSDDDCGFGMCNMNRQGQLLVGNTHDYSVQHGRALQQLNRSFVSCTSNALTEADSAYTLIDVILGKSDVTTVKKMNIWADSLNWTQGNKHVLMSGAYVGTLSHACASGKLKMCDTTYTFQQELNTERLSAEDVSAVSKLAPTDKVIARYSDTGLPAAIRGTNYTIFGLPLETLDNFDVVYKHIINSNE